MLIKQCTGPPRECVTRGGFELTTPLLRVRMLDHYTTALLI